MTVKTAPNPRKVLDTPMGDNDAGADTIREYLVKLLLRVWNEGEEFNSKRPFGNYSWEWEVYAALVDAGHVKGARDQYGDIDWVDDEAADEMIDDAIKSLGEVA